jgi:NTE family protein
VIRRLLLAAALFAAPAALHAQGACGPGRVALVLSGGGAKGMAHVGAIAALEARGIRPDLVVGTSMGAVVGALYASGHDARALDSLARVIPLAEAFRGYRPEPPPVFAGRPSLLVWAAEGGRLELQASTVAVPLVNRMLLTELLGATIAVGGDFDRLPIPFRAVAADLLADTIVVFRRGGLAEAVRASSSIPIVFPPVEIGGRPLVDGGILANIPVAIARAEGADRVIVVDVSDALEDSLDYRSPIAVTAQMVTLLSRQPLPPLGPGDLFIRPAIDDYQALDFRRGRVDSLILLGREAADAALAANECPFPVVPSFRHPVVPSPIHLGTVRVDGVPPDQGARLARGLLLLPDTDLPLDTLRSRIVTVFEREGLTSIWLDADSAERVNVGLRATPAPRRRAVFGAAFDADLGGRLWAGVVDRALVSPAWEGSAAVAFGANRLSFDAGFRRRFPVAPLVPTLALTAARERAEYFDGDLVGADAVGWQANGFLGLELVLPRGWSAAAGGGMVLWDDTDEPSRGAPFGSVRILRLGQPGERLAEASFTATPDWMFARAALAFRGRWGRLRFTPSLRAGWGEDVPIAFTEPLGGWTGFPGLPMGDRRSEREAYAGLGASFPVAGPVSVIGEAAAGRSRPLTRALHADDVVAGGRIGVGVRSRFGPILIAWGRNDEGGEQWVVRVGEWF